MNTEEINSLLKKHSSTRHVFRGVYARNRLPRRLTYPTALIANTDPDTLPGTHWVAVYIDSNGRGEYYDPAGRPPLHQTFLNFMNKQCTSWTFNTVRVQEVGSSVCGQHCIFYLVHRCADRSMIDVTRTLGKPEDATTRVLYFVNKISKMYLQCCC